MLNRYHEFQQFKPVVQLLAFSSTISVYKREQQLLDLIAITLACLVLSHGFGSQSMIYKMKTKAIPLTSCIQKKIVHKPVCPKAACQCSGQCLAWGIVVSCQNNSRNLTGNPIKQQFTKNNRLTRTVCIPYPYTVWNSTGIEMQHPNSKKYACREEYVNEHVKKILVYQNLYQSMLTITRTEIPTLCIRKRGEKFNPHLFHRWQISRVLSCSSPRNTHTVAEASFLHRKLIYFTFNL